MVEVQHHVPGFDAKTFGFIGLESVPGRRRFPARVAVLKPLPVQVVGEGLHFAFIAFGFDDVRFVNGRGCIFGYFKKLDELADCAVGFGRKRLHRRHARRHVVADTLLQREGIAVVFGQSQARNPRTALLVGHANGPIVGRVRVAVAGIKQVEIFPREIQPAVFVERFPIVFPDGLLKLTLPRRNRLVVRSGRRRKIVGRVSPHLMKIGVQVGHPLLVQGRPLLRFPLHLPGPVAVEVVEVVVHPSTRPGFAVLPGIGVGIEGSPYFLIVPIDVPVEAVGVGAGIEHHDGIGQDTPAGGILRVEQIEHHLHDSFRRNRLVAVNVVIHPGNGGGSGGRLPIHQPDAFEVIGANFFKLREV